MSANYSTNEPQQLSLLAPGSRQKTRVEVADRDSPAVAQDEGAASPAASEVFELRQDVVDRRFDMRRITSGGWRRTRFWRTRRFAAAPAATDGTRTAGPPRESGINAARVWDGTCGGAESKQKPSHFQ